MSAAILFPGQGSQFAGMADPWVSHPAAREVFDACSEALGRDVVELCRDEAALATTEVVQPAVFAVDVAAFRVLEAEGVEFVASAGHSLGEFAALVAADALELLPALHAVEVRGRSMQEASDATPSTMTALLGITAGQAAELCEIAGRGDVLQVANENAPAQVVISGSVPAIERAEELARSQKTKAIRLNVAGAFHSPLMKPALPAVREAIAALEFRNPRFPVIPNVNGKPTEDGAALRDLLTRQMVSPVRWETSMISMHDVLGVSDFAEAGPGEVLSKLTRRCVKEARGTAVGSPEAATAFAKALKDGDGA